MDKLSTLKLDNTPNYYTQGLLDIEKKKVEILSKKIAELMKEDIIEIDKNMLDNNNMIVEEVLPVVADDVQIVDDVQEQSVNDTVIENVNNTEEIMAPALAANYEFANMILVKPLDVEKVFKTLTVPEDSGEKDEEGEPIMQMVIKQIETESLLRKGIVLSIPYSLTLNTEKTTWMPVTIGDTVVYPDKRSIDFDLVSGSALIPQYEILAKIA